MTDSNSTIPFTIVGRESALANAIGEHLSKDGYHLTKTFSSLPDALSSLPSLLRDPSTRPRVVVIGRAFSDPDQYAIVSCAPDREGDGPGVAFLLANNKHITPALEARIGLNQENRGPPPADVIADRIRECLRDVGIYRGGAKEGGLAKDEVFGF